MDDKFNQSVIGYIFIPALAVPCTTSVSFFTNSEKMEVQFLTESEDNMLFDGVLTVRI